MLDLEVVPEQGFQADQWEFLLGMHFSQAISLVQSLVRVVKSAHVVYNEQAPLDHDLILDLPQDGFRLMFDSRSQRLKLIEVYNLKLVRLKYCGCVFNGPELVPSVEQIDRAFGATRPGSYDKQRHLFALNFRGLTFFFPVDLQYQPHYSHGLGSLRFPGDASPVLSKMLVYTGTNPSEPPVPPLPISCFKSHIYCDNCHVLRNDSGTRTLGIGLRLFTPSNNVLETRIVYFEREVLFGEDVQSVVSKLGTPSRIFYKSDDKMKIHSKESHKKVMNINSDYFFNYFTMGLDILFDSRSHQVIKFILHTNFPGNYDFNSYHRCAFSLRIARPPGPSTPQMSTSTTPQGQQAEQGHQGGGASGTTGTASGGGGGAGGGKNGKSPKVKKNKQNAQGGSQANDPIPPPPPPVTTNLQNPRPTGEKNWMAVAYDTHWEEVNDFSSSFQGSEDRLERPVVLTRSSSNNPFGSSLCYGVQDMIFEVMSNDHIASVTLYQAED